MEDITNKLKSNSLWNQIYHLIRKEVILEWRNKYALNGLLLYVTGTVFVCYLSFKVKHTGLNPAAWNALFWIIILFTATNAIAKSFNSESSSRNIYYFTLCDPRAIIISKIIYNSLILTILSFLCLFFYSLVMGNPVSDMPKYALLVLMGAFGFASTLSLISAIVSKSSNNIALMPILSFPVVIPMLLVLIKSSRYAIDGIETSAATSDLLVLSAINVIVITLSYLLFPYLWRS